MGTGRTDELIKEIAEATEFSKMKRGKAHSHDSKELVELVRNLKLHKCYILCKI